MRCFEGVTSLKVNLAKSALIGVGEVPNLDMLATDLGCRIGSLPVTYLGLPIGAQYKSVNVWNPVVERIQRRLLGWKANYLSKGGRLNLLKATLANIPVYYFSLFPKVVASKIEKLQKDFLWKGGDDKSRMHLVA